MLHGWGADAGDLSPLATLLDLPGCWFLLPNAPFNHPQVANGRAWYALETDDYDGLEESCQLLVDWLLGLETTTGISLANTFLCGFSQGGAMTLDVGLSFPLAGLACLSGYLHGQPHPCEESIPPVLIVHGTGDMVVPVTAAQKTRDLLTMQGVSVEYHELPMGHEIPPPALKTLEQFIKSKIG
ncbi:MAG: Carboxylesterase 2 [Chroococcopsis gigantea SAG 12.99]|jgi:phospholipase/carboxylesterase|nr:Carboxylesterase 2 [Chroococcopsis gigantea SAG 12.99]